MKKTAYALALLAGGLLLAGCSSDHVMQMKDGRTVVVQGKPQVDKATGMVVYTDENGQQQAVNQDQIKEMSSLDK
ncbi:lipoprotein [Erwinia typographi]|uniref:Lipoprotein n=1 Tax=Erwinia typographi TaxID=371042 RepID=A0A0A3ZEB5_9GAMM|nr:YgdI/YgdR family lipoprotein [Erwinia typographi]KGT95971.1 lipoprotein [Erwinia typographi]